VAGALKGFFSLHHRVQTGSGSHPTSYSVGTESSYLGVKRLGHEADHSPPSSYKVKNKVKVKIKSLCLTKHHVMKTHPFLN